MLTVREKGLLLNIIKHCNRIERKMENLTKEQFDQDDDIKEVVCFNLLQIGELAKNFEPEFIKMYDGVPWGKIKKLRDRVAHGYGSIDFEIIWRTASSDITPLRAYCQSLIELDNSK